MTTSGRFVYVCTNVGSEKFLRRDMQRLHPDWHPAYARPGFVTFKAVRGESPRPDILIDSIFARSYGITLENVSPGQIVARTAILLERLQDVLPVRLHVSCRDAAAAPAMMVAAELEGQLRDRFSSSIHPGISPAANDMVVDIVVVGESECWLGLHQHHAGHTPFAGGCPRLTMPPEAPSRAYLKMQEALLLTGAPVRAGETVVEIGAAPGGCSYCLLQHGLNVVGIDAARMSDLCVQYSGQPCFTHLDCAVSRVVAADLPPVVHWLALDMNARPAVALHALRHIRSLAGGGLQGAFLTLKLNNPGVQEYISTACRKLRGLGLQVVMQRQLASNHHEYFVYCLTRTKRESRKA